MKSFVLRDGEVNGATIEYYRPLQKSNDIAVVIFPGGGYKNLAPHEGEGYAHLLNTFGITAFVVKYRIAPNHFPAQLLDARIAIKFVRSKAEEFGIAKNKVLAMGSSAGGHLTALLCTYREELLDVEGELYKESYLPNGQILCYPVISSDERIFHKGSYENLLGELYAQKEEYSPDLLVNENTPRAFIWHTSEDASVSCLNSYRYAEALTQKRIPCELHIFPEGIHGLGVASKLPYVSQWIILLRNWLEKYYFV